jgi:hypothetical protein
MLGSPLSGSSLPHPRLVTITLNVNVRLHKVADLTDPNEQHRLEISAQELTGDWRGDRYRNPITSVSLPVGVAPTQLLGQALFGVPDLESFQTVSARIPTQRNLVVFPQKLLRGSRVEFNHPATGHTLVIP